MSYRIGTKITARMQRTTRLTITLFAVAACWCDKRDLRGVHGALLVLRYRSASESRCVPRQCPEAVRSGAESERTPQGFADPGATRRHAIGRK